MIGGQNLKKIILQCILRTLRLSNHIINLAKIHYKLLQYMRINPPIVFRIDSVK